MLCMIQARSSFHLVIRNTLPPILYGWPTNYSIVSTVPHTTDNSVNACHVTTQAECWPSMFPSSNRRRKSPSCFKYTRSWSYPTGTTLRRTQWVACRRSVTGRSTPSWWTQYGPTASGTTSHVTWWLCRTPSYRHLEHSSLPRTVLSADSSTASRPTPQVIWVVLTVLQAYRKIQSVPRSKHTHLRLQMTN